jgi:cell division protein ZapA (FtsZ GTPase activity inhibitor)
LVALRYTTRQAGDQKAGVLASLNSQLSQLTGKGEDLAACTKSYRQCIFKLNHKMNKLSGQVSSTTRQTLSSLLVRCRDVHLCEHAKQHA